MFKHSIKYLLVVVFTLTATQKSIAGMFTFYDHGGMYSDKDTLAHPYVKAGDEGPDFSIPDLNGKMVNLSDFRGKYVLLDFWASWCKPCRAVHPLLIELYQKYKRSNIEFISVSVDENRDKWEQAVIKDSLPWLHISDLKGLENEAAIKYSVGPLPTTFLIGPDGKIIARMKKITDLGRELRKAFGTEYGE